MMQTLGPYAWHIGFVLVALVSAGLLYDKLVPNTTIVVRYAPTLTKDNADGAVIFRTDGGANVFVYFTITGKYRPRQLTMTQTRDICAQVRKLSVTPYAWPATSVDLYVDGQFRTFLVPKKA